MLLLDAISELVVPILIGPVEAGAIVAAQEGVVPPRPMTHDLLCEVIRAEGDTLRRVVITSLEDGVFHAELELGNGAHVDSRASDAIAVALRLGAPVLCSAEVVADAGVQVEPVIVEEPEEMDVEAFREFLDQVQPEDFETEPPAAGDAAGEGDEDEPSP